MKTVIAILVVSMFTFVALGAHAKCYSGNNWKKDGNVMYVCMKGDESWENRHKAEAICEKVVGSKCDAVSTYSGSCNGTCYDDSGNKHQALSGY